MLWTVICWFFRRLWSQCLKLLIFVGVIGIGYLACILSPSLLSANFEQKTRAIEILLLSVGSLSILLLAAQLKQQAAWNRVLSYHQHFSQLPRPENVTAFHACLARLSIDLPTVATPLDDIQAGTVIADTFNDPALGVNGRNARVICQSYLDDFEEFCAAINAGVVSESYAREIEGSRTIRAFFGLEIFIKKLRERQAQILNAAPQLGRGAHPTTQMQSKYYEELERVAKRWRRKREREHRTHSDVSVLLKEYLGIDTKV